MSRIDPVQQCAICQTLGIRRAGGTMGQSDAALAGVSGANLAGKSSKLSTVSCHLTCWWSLPIRGQS